MAIDPISSGSVVANPAYVNPSQRSEQAAAPAQVGQDAQKATQTTKTDTVTISPQAVRKLASDGDTAAQEAKEGVAEKAGEALKGRK